MPPKQGPKWLPPDDEQLAKSWIKILEDTIQSTGQKKDDFWKRIAKDFNAHGTVERDWNHCKNRWGQHIQKDSLKFSAIYCKLEKNQPSGSVLTDLLPDANKAYYEQEGKKFLFEQAWLVIKDLPKWINLFENWNPQDLGATILAPNPSTPATPANTLPITSQSPSASQMISKGSWKRLTGVHATKQAMKQHHYNAKKIKILLNRSSDYRDQTLAMKKMNKIFQAVAKAEVSQTNMEIMSKDINNLPDKASQEFLQLQKEMILQDMRDQLEARKTLAAQKAKENKQLGSLAKKCSKSLATG
ncbi:hypothetical protein PTTG_09321 [Puccinia triticina 1-1 BBBD Race 1]|uniref:Myb-like domain-containing protein n=1 Tax=Puccinia triticina (isolate 1-1 / race 1 (BBBD)) TaxID=630390 RepID=A0A180G8B8_PUCT1|nr:hypothetical protein PTTG_09321 [Puccinia triticina 1-1 BBBD Race 1]